MGRDIAPISHRLPRACALATRRAGLSLPSFYLCPCFLASHPGLVGYSLSSCSLPPQQVLALFLLHGVERAPRKSTFMPTRTSPPALGATAPLLPSVAMIENSGSRQQGWSVFRRFRHVTAMLRVVTTGHCGQCSSSCHSVLHYCGPEQSDSRSRLVLYFSGGRCLWVAQPGFGGSGPRSG